MKRTLTITALLFISLMSSTQAFDKRGCKSYSMLSDYCKSTDSIYKNIQNCLKKESVSTFGFYSKDISKSCQKASLHLKQSSGKVVAKKA